MGLTSISFYSFSKKKKEKKVFVHSKESLLWGLKDKEYEYKNKFDGSDTLILT